MGEIKREVYKEIKALFWEALWKNRSDILVTPEELNIIAKLSELSHIPLHRFETFMDYTGKKILRFKKAKDKDNGWAAYDYYFYPVCFKGGCAYSQRACPKTGERIEIKDEELMRLIRSETGIQGYGDERHIGFKAIAGGRR